MSVGAISVSGACLTTLNGASRSRSISMRAQRIETHLGVVLDGLAEVAGLEGLVAQAARRMDEMDQCGMEQFVSEREAYHNRVPVPSPHSEAERTSSSPRRLRPAWLLFAAPAAAAAAGLLDEWVDGLRGRREKEQKCGVETVADALQGSGIGVGRLRFTQPEVGSVLNQARPPGVGASY